MPWGAYVKYAGRSGWSSGWTCWGASSSFAWALEGVLPWASSPSSGTPANAAAWAFAFASPRATDSSLACFDLSFSRTLEVTLFMISMGAFVAASTAPTAFEAESVMSLTSSKI